MSETAALRETMLEVTPSRDVVRASRLFELLRDQWGSVCERRLWRALAWLVARGRLVRVGIKCDAYASGYRRAST